MKKIYAMMAAASLCAASASAATPFSRVLATAAEGNLNPSEMVTIGKSEKPLQLNKAEFANKQFNNRASRADEVALPTFAPQYSMVVTWNTSRIRNNFTIDYKGGNTVTFNDWFDIMSETDHPIPVEGTYKMYPWEVDENGTTQDFPTIQFEDGVTVFKDFSAQSNTGAVTVTDLHLYLCDDGGLYTGGVPLIVDETGDIMLPSTQYDLFLGWESSAGRYSGWQFKSPTFSAIRGYQEMSIAQIKSDYSGFEFVEYEDEVSGETSPYTYTLNYKYDEAEKTLWVTNLGLAEYAIPFTIEDNKAYVDKPYLMYDLYDAQGNALDESAFIATVTLDGISANPVGVGCAATIDNSDPENTIINISGTWGGFYEDSNTLVPIEIGDNLYSIFQNTKLTLFGKPFVSAGVGSVAVDSNENAPVEYYNLQGVKVLNPAAGQLVIKKQGTKTTKMIMR